MEEGNGSIPRPVIRGYFRRVGQISNSPLPIPRISLLIKRPILHFAPRLPRAIMKGEGGTRGFFSILAPKRILLKGFFFSDFNFSLSRFDFQLRID